MRPAAALLVLLAAASASCATGEGEERRSVPRPHALAAAHSDQRRPMSSTVIGPDNPMLADGARALEAGDAVEGVRLTLEGLKQPSPVHDLAAGRANLCAGYVLLQRYTEALAACNLSIALDPSNWRAYNNRAAVFAAEGLYELAAQDIQTGLKIAPDSAILLRSLAIIHHDQEWLRHHRRYAPDA